MKGRMVKAVIVAIGTELTWGVSVDTNTAYLAGRLSERGIDVCEHITVPDELSAQTEALRRAAATSELVVITGGLGPTQDDLTRQVIAECMGVDLVHNNLCEQQIRDHFDRRGRQMRPQNLVQALIPRGAEPLSNPVGTAPGVHAVITGAAVFALPGVPSEMKHMFDQHVVPWLDDHCDAYGVARFLKCYGAGESDIAARIEDLMRPGRNPAVGTTASQGVITVRIYARASTAEHAHALADADAQVVRSRLGDLLFGEADDTLATAIGRVLTDRGQMLGTAESCTGGMIGAYFTDAPGSSGYYAGGAVVYSNDLKMKMLGVSAEMLDTYGAVSEQVARAMVAGCLALTGVDYAVSDTGIAGPGGATDGKDVGLVYVAAGSSKAIHVHRYQFGPLGREAVRRRTVTATAGLLWQVLEAEAR